jgi:transcriptional regulator with XRE-family HTH domain
MLTENEKAYLWRRAMGFSRAKLARLTGFSAGIYRENGKPIADATMQRYRLACGALTADVSFNWYRAKVSVNGTSVDIPVARE